MVMWQATRCSTCISSTRKRPSCWHIDMSGTIFDPKGLDLEEVVKLFKEQKPLRHYPPEKLSDGGFLLDARTKREQTAYAQQTLCWKKVNGKLIEDWLSGNEMNHLLRHNVHQVKADVFIPGGGRPRTLNEQNYKDFLDETGKPTSKAIVEGANLYLTPAADADSKSSMLLLSKTARPIRAASPALHLRSWLRLFI